MSGHHKWTETRDRRARERLGELVRETWVAWAAEQPSAKPSWLVPWEELGEEQREVDMRIGEAIVRDALERIRRLADGVNATYLRAPGPRELGEVFTEWQGKPTPFADLLDTAIANIPKR